MDDDFPKEPPRFWIAVSIFVATLALIVIMLVYTTVRAEAQEMMCVPLGELTKELAEKYSEQPAWGGVVAEGPNRFALFTSPQGTWTLVSLPSPEVACPMAGGTGAVFFRADRGA